MQKSSKLPKRNPPGTLIADWKYLYFHKNMYCEGHKENQSVACFLNGKTKQEQYLVLKSIEAETITFAVDTKVIESKC